MTGVALEQDQHFTLRHTDLWCRARAQVRRWDLDVAACRQSHLAPRYFTIKENALECRWDARAVWANIPFSNIAPWVARAWEAMDCGESGRIAMLMPGTRTEQPWWQRDIEPFRDRGPRRGIWLASHFLPERTRFGNPMDPRGLAVGSPPFSCVLLVWSRKQLVQTPGHLQGAT